MSRTNTQHRNETRIVVDPNVPTIEIIREFDAPPERVYRAHTHPDLVAKWLGPKDISTRIDSWDARTGGSWRYVAVRDGEEIASFYGSFHELRPDERIVQTFTYEGVPDGVSLETATFEDLGGGRTRSIAIAMVQWTGPYLHAPVLPWTLIKDDASIKSAAQIIERTPRQLFGGGTSISGAIDYAATLFPRSPYRALRRVIDVSGDGSNNRGRPVTLARDEAVAGGIGINGLPILALEPDLDRYYYDSVIGGPGAFVIAAQSYETFGEAILKKLITEIAASDRRVPIARTMP